MLAGAVNIKFMADIMDLQAKMTQAQNSVAGAMGNIEKAVNQAKTALGALGIGLSVGSIVAHVKGIIDAADAMNDLSQRTGIAVKDLAKYELAAAQSGTTMEALAKGVKGVSINLLEHGDALKKAGLSATNADDALMQLADLFKAMPDGMEKTALAVKMFGKSGMDLIPMLNGGSEGLKEAAAESAKYAATMATLAPQADKFNDNLAKLGMLGKIAGMSLMNDMLPALLRISQTMIDAKQNGQGFWATMNAGIWAFENEMSKSMPDTFESYATSMPRQITNLKYELAGLKRTEEGLAFFDPFGNLEKTKVSIKEMTRDLGNAEEAYKKYLITVNGPAGGDKGGSAVRPNTAIADWKAQYKAMMAAIGDSSKVVKEAESEYDKLANKLSTDVVKAAAEAEAAQLGYNKSQTEFAALKMSELWNTLSEDQRINLEALYELKSESEDLTEATKRLSKAELDAATARDKFNTSLIDGLEKMQKDTQAQQEANDRMGLGKEVIAALDAAKLESQAVTLDLLAIKTLDKNLDEVQYNLYKAQAEELRNLAKLKGQGGIKEAGIEAAKASADEWKKGWEETDRIAREAFTGWAENGKNMAETIGDALKKAMFSAIYEATIKPIAFSIYSSIAGAPAGANALNQAGSAAGIYNAGSALGFVGAGTSAFAAGSTLASAGMGTEAFSAGLTMMTEATGASSFMAGAGQALGAIGPVGWAALAAIAVLSLQDHGTPTQNTGNASASFNATGTRTAYDTYFGGSSANTDAMIGNMQLAYMAGAKSLGIGTVATNFNYGSNTGKDSQNPQFALGGSAGSGYFYQGETTYSDAAVSLAASRAVFAALQGSELPQYLAKVFNSATVGTMTQDQITNTLAFASSLKQVRDALLETREPLQILKDNVASGFAELQTSASSFKTDFVAAIDAGITPANLAAWQSLGTNMEQLAQATGTADTAVKELGRSLSDIASERARLQDQYDTLVMTSAELLNKQRNALDSSNQALFDQVQAAQATKTAAESAAQAQLDAAAATQQLADAAAQAAAQLAATNKTWQDQLDLLTGAQTDRSIALRDAGDETTRALMRQVYAQQDLQSASASAAKTIADAVTAINSNLTAAQTATNTALSNVASAIAAQRTIKEAAVSAAQAQVDAITSVFDALQSNIKDLAPTSAAAGNAWLDAAIRSGGTSDQKGLADAMAAARGGLSNNNFSSATDAARANQMLVNKLSTLSGMAGGQISGAQAQLAAAQSAVTALDALLQSAQDQVSALRGTGTLSVTDAISTMQLAVVAELQAIKANQITAAGGLLGGAKTYTMQEAVAALKAAMATGASAGAVVNAANVNYGISAADVAKVATVTGNADVVAAANAAQTIIHSAGGLLGSAQDWTMAQAEAAITNSMSQGYDVATVIKGAWQNWGISEADVRAAGRAAGIPGFARGTNWVPQDMLAQIHQGEAIIPAPFNPAKYGRDSGNDALVTEIKALREDNANMRAELRAIAGHTAKTSRLLDRAMPDGDAISTRVAA